MINFQLFGKYVTTLFFYCFSFFFFISFIFSCPLWAEEGNEAESPGTAPSPSEPEENPISKAMKAEAESYGSSHTVHLLEEGDGADQKEYQEDGQENKDKGAKRTQMLGTSLAGIGSGLIAIGIAKNNSKCRCGKPYISKGKYFLNGAVASFLASMIMKNNSSKGQDNTSLLAALPPAYPDPEVPVPNYPDPELPPPDNPTNPVVSGPDNPNNPNNPNNPVVSGPNNNPNNFVVSAPNPLTALTHEPKTEKLLFNVRERGSEELQKSIEQLEKSHGIDGDDLLRSIAATGGENLGLLLAEKGLIDDADAFEAAIEAEGLDLAALEEEYKAGEFEDLASLAALDEEAHFVGGGNTLERKNKTASSKKKSKSEVFDSIIRKLASGKSFLKDKKKGRGGKASLTSIDLGKEKASLGLGKRKASLGSIHRKGQKANFYREKTLFERVHLYYNSRSHEFYGMDHFLRFDRKKAGFFQEEEDKPIYKERR